MKNIIVERTNNSPEINLSADNSTAIFIGRSIHSDSFNFYEPIIKWFNGYDNKTLKMDFMFDHVNTTTNKCLLQILLKLKSKSKEGLEISVSWHYDEDDDDMLETGEELELLSDIKFEYKIIEE